jgi:hypothetical protein
LTSRKGSAHRVKGRLGRPDPRLDARREGLVDLHAREAELAQPGGGRAGDARRGPRASRQRQRRHLVRLEADLGQGRLAGVDAVAHLVVEEDVDHRGGDGNAHLSQLVLVAFEHPVERLDGRCFGVGRQ